MKIVDHPALGRLTYGDDVPDAAIHQDIDRRILGLMTPQPKTTALGQVKETVKGIVPGIGGIAESAAKGVGGFYADLARAYGIGPGAEPVVKGIGEIGQQVAESPVGKFFEPGAGYETAPKIGRALGSIAGIAASRLLGPLAPLTTGAAAGAGEQVERAIEAGAVPMDRSLATILGGATGLTEALPIELAFGRAMKLMPGSLKSQGLQLIRNAALTGGVEGAQEAAQGFLQNLIAKGLYKPDQELVEGLGEQAALGAGAGAIFQTALDLTIGRRAMRRRAGEQAPSEAAPEEPQAPAGPTEEEQKAARRQEIRAKQLAQGINIIDEEDLDALGIPKGKKADNTYSKLLGKNLSDPDQFGQVEKIFGEYLSGSRQKFNDISTIERVLDKQIAGEPLNLFEDLVVRNYNGEDVDAYLMSRLQELRARAPVAEAAVEAAPVKPKTAQEIAKEQAEIARKEIQLIDDIRNKKFANTEAGREKEAEFLGVYSNLAAQGRLPQNVIDALNERLDEAARSGVYKPKQKEDKALLKGAGVTPIVPPAQGEGLAAAQPDLFGDITAQGPEVTRGSSQEAEFMRQRAEFENDLQQLNVATQASVAGVPNAEAVVQSASAKVADKIDKIPFSIGELIDIRNRIVRQGVQVPGSDVLLDAVNRKIAEQAGQMPEDEEAARQMQLFPETQAELPLGIQGELFEPAGEVSRLPEATVEETLTREQLQTVGIAANKIKQYEGKNINDEGVAEGIRTDLTNRALNFRRELDKARREYAAILGPEGVIAGKKAKAAELEKRIASLEEAYSAAQENLRLFPALEQGQLAFDALRPVEPEAFPTPTEQEEEKRFRKIQADEAAGEAAREEGVASELETRLPMGRTLDDVQTLIDRIRPLRGKINNDKATPAEQAQYDEDLSTLFSMVKGPGRIQLQFESTGPAALALNRAFARAEGFLKNLSRKERSRLARKLVELRGRTAEREVATKVLGKQARREAEQFPEEGVRIEARQERERKVQEAKSKETKARAAEAVKETATLKTRAAFTAVMKLNRDISSQDEIKELRQNIRDYTDLNGNIDFAGLAKLYDVDSKKLKELYDDERVRLSGQDVETRKQKEAAEREEADQKAAEKRAEEERKKIEAEEKTRVETFKSVRGMEPQPLAQLVQTVSDMKGADLQPVLRNIARTGKVAENLQNRIDGSFESTIPYKDLPKRQLTPQEIKDRKKDIQEQAKKYGRTVDDLEAEVRAKLSSTVRTRKGTEVTNNWASFDTAYNYAILRSDDKFAIIAPARFNINDLLGSFRVKYPKSKVEIMGSGNVANVKYITFTADVEAKGPAPEFVITPQAVAQQRKAEKIAGEKVSKVTELLTSATYNDLKNGVTVDRAVEQFGMDATMRALGDLRAQRATQREKVGKFAMDDRVLDSALNYLQGKYGSQVYFSDRVTRADEKPNVGFANEFLNKVGVDKTTYFVSDLLKTIARHEGNSEVGRTARVILTQASKFGLDKIGVFYNPNENAGSYFANVYNANGDRVSSIVIGKGHLYLPDVSLHEIIHAVTVEQMHKVNDPNYKRTGARWEDAAQGLIDLHRFMEFYIGDKVSMGSWASNLSENELKTLKDLQGQYGMKDAREFVAEALSDENFKTLLKKIPAKEFINWIKQYKPSKADERRLTMFEKLVKGARNVYEFFTRLLRQALNLPDSSQTVFDLTVNQFGKLIQQSTPASVMKGRPNEVTISAKGVPATPKKYGRDPLPADIIKILDNIKNNPALDVPVIKGKADAERAAKTGVLPLLAMNQIRDIYGSDPRLKELSNYYTATQKMGGYRNALRERYADVLNDFYKVTRAHKNLKDQIYEVINEGSRLEVDVLKPNSDYKDAAVKADHKRLQAMYNAFPQDVKDFYSKYRKNNDYILDQIKESMIARATSYVSDAESKAEIRAMIDKKIDSFKEKGPYAPLMFFGNNWVNVQMAEDKTLPFSFETKTQADEFAKQMKAKGYAVKQFESIKELKAKGAPRAGFFKQLEQVLDRNRVNPRAKDELYQMTLMYLPEESFMRQFQNRKGAPTYERDALRNYGELADRVVHQLPKARYLSEMDSAIETMKAKVKQDPDDVAGRVLGEVEKHFDAAMNPVISPWATRLGNLGFAWYMGANPSAAVVQLLQTPGVTLPYLAPKYGLNPTMTELVKAGQDFFGGEMSAGKGFFSIKTNKNLSAIEKKAVQELYDLNVIPPAATEVGDIETMTGLKAETPLERVGKRVNFALGYMFQNAERFNREITALAAFRLEYNRSKNYEKAIQAASDAVVETQGDYSDMNAPRMFKHPAAKVLLMFKKFLQMMLYLYGRNLQIVMQRNKFTPEERALARNRLAGLLGTSAAMSGVVGMPFYWMVEFVMNAIGDDDDPYYDFTTSLRETLPEFMAAGIPGALTGANIASRTGFRDMPLLGFFPGIGAGASKADDSEGAIMDTLKAATGPVGGIFLNAGRGIDQINDGKVGRGIETMMPSVVKNFMKSYRFGEEGARTLRGDPIVGNVSGYDMALQAFGFAPLELATKQEKVNVAMGMQTDAQRSKQRAYGLINLALDNGDSDGYKYALELVDKHNEKYPGFEILPKQILQSYKAFQKRSSEMIGGVYLEKGLRPYLRGIIEE